MTRYFAAEDRISRSPIEGGVEITAEQYRQALDGMMEGKVVSVERGFVVADPPEPERPPEPEPEPPTYEERVALALSEVAPLPVLVKEIILAMNHAQLSGQINWSQPMDTIINRTMAALSKADAVERPKADQR